MIRARYDATSKALYFTGYTKGLQVTDADLNPRTLAYRVRARNIGKGDGALEYTASVFLAPSAVN